MDFYFLYPENLNIIYEKIKNKKLFFTSSISITVCLDISTSKKKRNFSFESKIFKNKFIFWLCKRNFIKIIVDKNIIDLNPLKGIRILYASGCKNLSNVDALYFYQ